MIAFLISLTLSVQGVPVLPNQGGTVSGVLKSSAGTPAVGIRVAAVARPDSLEDATNAAAMAGLAETDEMGRFRLENIPPGRYYIAAGRLDMQTYYPGVLETRSATAILITPGASVSNIDFVLKDSSSGRASAGVLGLVIASAAEVSVGVTVEGGAKPPLFSSRGFTGLVFTQAGNNARTSISLNRTSVSLTGPFSAAGSDYKVLVENLPDGYSAKSIVYGSADLMVTDLHIPAARFGGSNQLLQFLLTSSQGLSTVLTVTPPPPPPALNTINVVLTSAPLTGKTNSGANVSGRIPSFKGPRSIYISGNPGTLYSDGTFEFRGVPSGRHIVLTGNNTSFLASARRGGCCGRPR